MPPEYKSFGCLPADQFIPQLMEHLRLRYYAGLLTAAQYYGAACNVATPNLACDPVCHCP